MANNLHVSFDSLSHANYHEITDVIKSLGKWARIDRYLWYIDSECSVDEVVNRIEPELGLDDRLYIVDSTNNESAWVNLSKEALTALDECWESSPDIPFGLRKVALSPESGRVVSMNKKRQGISKTNAGFFSRKPRRAYISIDGEGTIRFSKRFLAENGLADFQEVTPYYDREQSVLVFKFERFNQAPEIEIEEDPEEIGQDVPSISLTWTKRDLFSEWGLSPKKHRGKYKPVKIVHEEFGELFIIHIARFA